jgi:tryptophan 2,3-dioxygenase
VRSTVLLLDAPELVRRWARRPPGVSLEAWCAAFPFDAVAEHWRSVGRAQVGSAAIAAVDEAAVVLAADDTPAEPPAWAWFLRTWLPMLVDIGHGRCTYATYVGTPALVQGLASNDIDADPCVALLLAHLLRHQLDAPVDPAHPTIPAVPVSRVAAMAESLLRHRRDQAPVVGARSLVAAVLGAAPPALARQADLLAMPMTTVHEEHLFLRALQLFEAVFASMLTEVESARSLLDINEVDGAAAALGSASDRLGRAIPFFRILATIHPDEFALIREETPGASGLQSTSFKAIELACARQEPTRLASPGYGEPVVAALVAAEAEAGRPSIEDHALRLRALADGRPAVDRLVAAIVSLDHRWGQWKKAHWATASRLIGEVPGTGGTTGAAYLRAHVDGRLFPAFWSGNPAL